MPPKKAAAPAAPPPPPNPDDGNEWVGNLRTFCRNLGPAGHRVFKRAMTHRDRSLRAHGWDTIAAQLEHWHRIMRLSEIYVGGDQYEPPEMLIEDALRELCSDLNFAWELHDSDASEEDDDETWQDEDARLEGIIARQYEDLAADRDALPPRPAPSPVDPYLACAPSHPMGLLPHVADPHGKHRTQLAWQPRGGDPVDLPADIVSRFATRIKIIQPKCNLHATWAGLGADMVEAMMDAVLDGVSPNSRTLADMLILGFELVPPYTVFDMEPNQVRDIVVVGSPGEAWAVFNGDNTQRFFSDR